jgi:TRAP-type C4-dicarboxylate transport system permease small subunit
VVHGTTRGLRAGVPATINRQRWDLVEDSTFAAIEGPMIVAGRIVAALDHAVGRVVAAGAILVLPLSLLLSLQWPLREVVHAYAREANDVAQLLFGTYVSVAITAATRAHAHLAVDAIARRYPPALQAALARLAAVLVVVPWSAFVLVAAWPSVRQSVLQMEAFPETFNAGYFVLKLALLLLVALTLVQALLDAARPGKTGPA